MIEVDAVSPAQQGKSLCKVGGTHVASYFFHGRSTSLLVSEGGNGIAMKHLYFGSFSRTCSTLNFYAVMTCT